MLPVPAPTLPCYRTIQEVGSVELDSWLGGRNLQDTPTRWVTDSKHQREVFLTSVDVVAACNVCMLSAGQLYQTWQHVCLSRHLQVMTDRSYGQTLGREAPSDEGQLELVF